MKGETVAGGSVAGETVAGGRGTTGPVSHREPLVGLGPELTSEERARYSRQLLMPSIGVDGQRRLKNARVLSIGAGGLGSPSLLYLAAAGVGTLGVVDDDRVDASNLHRQVIHGTNTLGELKADSAKTRIGQLNPLVDVRTYPTRLTSENALDILRGYDLVLDGSDNFATRYLVADACEILGLPLVWGSLLREHGQVSVSWSGHGATYRDVFPEMPDPASVPTCAQAGVLGATCAAIGSAMANEAIKLITGSGRVLIGSLLLHDALQATWREISLQPDPTRLPVTELADSYEFDCGAAGPEDSHGAAPVPAITVDELADLLIARARGEKDFVVLDARTPEEAEIAAIDGAQLRGVDDLVAAPQELAVGVRYYVHCHSGARSARAVRALREAGLDAVDVTGGIEAWQQSGYPVVPG